MNQKFKKNPSLNTKKLLTQTFPLIHKSSLKDGTVVPIKVGEKIFNIVKMSDGHYAYPQRCPHRGTDLKHATILDNSLVCPYHGWQISNKGQVNSPYVGQVNCQFLPKKLIEKFDLLWWMPDSDSTSSFPISYPDDFHFTGTTSMMLSAPFYVVLDNFNEGSHTPYVHFWMTSPEPKVKEMNFSWQQLEDCVQINYKSLLKPQLIMNFFAKNIYWDISWKTYVNPVRMEYHSKFVNHEGKKAIFDNYNIYYLIPCGNDKTWIHALSFSEIPPYLKWSKPIFKLISKMYTKNQIMEDEHFYKKISDIPQDLSALALDKFDEPLVAIRSMLKSSGLEESLHE